MRHFGNKHVCMSKNIAFWQIIIIIMIIIWVIFSLNIIKDWEDKLIVRLQLFLLLILLRQAVLSHMTVRSKSSICRCLLLKRLSLLLSQSWHSSQPVWETWKLISAYKTQLHWHTRRAVRYALPISVSQPNYTGTLFTDSYISQITQYFGRPVYSAACWYQ